MALIATLIIGIVALLGAGTADVTTVFAARQQAIAAAEAAALAAADAASWLNDANPSDEAHRLASANHAALVSCSCAEGTTQVEVVVTVQPRARFVAAWFDLELRVKRRARVDDWVPTWAP